MKRKLMTCLKIVTAQFLFVPLCLFLLVYYGPFENVRGLVVYTAVHTASHKWLATAFLGEDRTEKIVDKYKTIMINPGQNASGVHVGHAGSRKIEVIDVQAGLAKGKLMIVENPFMLDLCVARNPKLVDETLTGMVLRKKAIGGINAGGVMQNESRESRRVEGVIVENGVIINWEFEGETATVIGFDYGGRLMIKEVSQPEEVNALNLNFAVSFGPCLISNGEKLVERVGPALQPRAAIGQRKDGAVLLLALDGRYMDSPGATLKDVQDILFSYGAWNAANLDGGSSAEMVYDGNVQNRPSDTFERPLATAFLVMPNEK